MRELGLTLQNDDVAFMMEQANCKIPGRIYYEGQHLHVFAPFLKSKHTFASVLKGNVIREIENRQYNVGNLKVCSIVCLFVPVGVGMAIP